MIALLALQAKRFRERMERDFVPQSTHQSTPKQSHTCPSLIKLYNDWVWDKTYIERHPKATEYSHVLSDMIEGQA
jgi:hypothetical protein